MERTFERRRQPFTLSLAILLLSPQMTFADQPRLHIDWPANWEVQQSGPHGQPAVRLQARQHVGDRVAQELAMTVITTEVAHEPITNASIKDFASQLRNRFISPAGMSELRSFADDRGYYFVVTDRRSEKSPQYKHVIEGVMLDSGYLIDFALQSNDANAPDTLGMLRALEELTIR